MATEEIEQAHGQDTSAVEAVNAEAVADELVEDVSIDGMCGVY